MTMHAYAHYTNPPKRSWPFTNGRVEFWPAKTARASQFRIGPACWPATAVTAARIMRVKGATLIEEEHVFQTAIGIDPTPDEINRKAGVIGSAAMEAVCNEIADLGQRPPQWARLVTIEEITKHVLSGVPVMVSVAWHYPQTGAIGNVRHQTIQPFAPAPTPNHAICLCAYRVNHTGGAWFWKRQFGPCFGFVDPANPSFNTWIRRTHLDKHIVRSEYGAAEAFIFVP